MKSIGHIATNTFRKSAAGIGCRNRRISQFIHRAKPCLLAVVVTILTTSTSIAQRKDNDTLRHQVNELIYKSQYDSAQKLALRHLLQKDLDPKEVFHTRMLYGEAIRSSARPLEAIAEFKKARNIASDFVDSKLYLSHVNMSIAGSYFDIPDYERAREFASQSIKSSPDTTISPIGHAANYLILGYCDYLDQKFKSAEEFYRKGRDEYLKRDKNCELPLYYTKMASLYNTQHEHKRAIAFIDSARTSSKSCDINAYRVLTETTLFNIYKENNDFQAALEKSQEIHLMNEHIQYEEQRARMKKLEQEYEAQLNRNRISGLEAINDKNVLILKKQQQLLWVSGIGLTLLAVLLIGLYMVNIRRRRANEQLKILNSKLEEKVLARTNHLEKANERIRKHSSELDSQNKKMMDFYHIITHNLRAPLGNLSMLVELIAETEDVQKRNELLGHMKPATHNLNQTVNELLEAIQLSSEEPQSTQPTPIDACLKESLESLQPQIEAAIAEIESNFVEASTVLYPKKFLDSLFHNLISNALKYRSEERPLKIRIETHKQRDYTQLTFSDNGRGIDMKKFGHLLFKAGKTFHHHPDAKGFGLYMTKMQVENCGGEIWIESEPDKGTTVFVRFKE